MTCEGSIAFHIKCDAEIPFLRTYSNTTDRHIKRRPFASVLTTGLKLVSRSSSSIFFKEKESQVELFSGFNFYNYNNHIPLQPTRSAKTEKKNISLLF